MQCAQCVVSIAALSDVHSKARGVFRRVEAGGCCRQARTVLWYEAPHNYKSRSLIIDNSDFNVFGLEGLF